ncbi:unnamed protein product [Calypogeia fissa]
MGFWDMVSQIVSTKDHIKDEQRSRFHKLVPCGSSKQMRVMVAESSMPRDAPQALDETIWRKTPPDLVWKMIAKHIGSQPIHAVFEHSLLCKDLKNFLTVPNLLKECPAGLNHGSRMLKRKCKRRSDGVFVLDTNDAEVEGRLPPVPSTIPLKGLSLDEVSLLTGQGGETGLIYMEIGRAPDDFLRTEKKWFVFNPVTKSVRQLCLAYSECKPQIHLLSWVDRFGSGYVSWASNGGYEMYPLSYDLDTESWKRIGSGFTTRGLLWTEKAVHDNVVYLRYEDLEHKDLLIMFDIQDHKFHEVRTEGLPEYIRSPFLFSTQGHIYLAAGLPELFKTVSKVDRVVLYQLKIDETGEYKWKEFIEMERELLAELTGTWHDISELKFLHTHHGLLVASSVRKRWRDGAHVKKLRKSWSNKSHCHVKVAACSFITKSWGKNEAHGLGQNFDFTSTVYTPRLDIAA